MSLNTCTSIFFFLQSTHSYTRGLRVTAAYMFDVGSRADRIYARLPPLASLLFAHIGDIMSICASVCEPNCVFTSDCAVRVQTAHVSARSCASARACDSV